ncbi:MAG: hypothetical protein JXA01_02580 [Dehalococcoidia bacterium]|nr:hypothetical protein [Dehalococcoidia bacterium]
MKTKMVLIYAVILAILAVILPLINIPLPIGNPNLGSTPATLAALYLPWPVCIVIALIKGIASSIITGRTWVEMPAGIGDALMALFTFWMARHLHRGWVAVLGQASRIIFTGGAVALCVSIAVSLNFLTPASAPITGLTASLLPDIGISWLEITIPAIILSVAVNAIVSLIIVLLFSRPIQNSLKK